MKGYPNLDTKAATANQAMDTILALTEKLQRAEKRAMAAELISERRRHWKNDDMSIPDRIWEECLVAKLLTDTYAREVMRKAEERDELAALVERLAEKLRSTLENCAIAQFGSSYYEDTDKLLALTGPAALADLKARVRREALEEAAKLADVYNEAPYFSTGAEMIAAELRRMAGGPHA
jgi:hypothetical protein